MTLDEAAFSDDDSEQNLVDAPQVSAQKKESPTRNDIPVTGDKKLESIDCGRHATHEVDPEFYYYYQGTVTL